jgi:fatty acid desaturase
VANARSRSAIEWPTVVLLIGFFLAWGAVIAFHDSIPWPLQLAAFVYLGGLWMSLGHELLHGHPTPWSRVNSAIGFLPLSFWLPFSRYKTLHRKHHQSDLTHPEDDPESFYVAPPVWQSAGPVRRRWFLFLRTIPGRLTVGVPRGIVRFWLRELRTVRSPKIIAQWTAHLVACVLLGWWLFVSMGVSPVLYIIGFCLGGAACTQLRSFAEHAATQQGTRSAVVKAGPVASFLFLNNNLHHTHHALPDLEWYRLPALHRELGSDELAAAGAGLYSGGYWEIVRMFFFTPFCQPDHPLSAGARPHGSRGLV